MSNQNESDFHNRCVRFSNQIFEAVDKESSLDVKLNIFHRYLVHFCNQGVNSKEVALTFCKRFLLCFGIRIVEIEEVNNGRGD